MRGIAPRIVYSRPADSSVPGQLFLQSHVFLCRGKRHWVILDVNRDKYLCVDRRQFDALGPSLQGWEGSGPEATPLADDAATLAKDLLGLGILSDRAAHAKDALPTAYPLPTEAPDPDLPARPRRWSYIHAGSFFLSSARASRELQRQRFQLTVEFVRARKSRNAARAGPLDIERARSLAAVFDRLRWFYPRSYLCLFDSLALVHFLARFQVYPDWVFGVNADPFEAHCWVQAGSVVLNDTVARISGFTPIMYV
jgi:hypothetical protein